MIQEKYGDYLVDPTFAFGEADAPELKGYRLGDELRSLLENIKLHDTDVDLYNKATSSTELLQDKFTICDVTEAPRLLWLIGFPTTTYLKTQQEWSRAVATLKGVGSRIRQMGKIKDFGFPLIDSNEDTECDLARIEHVKKVLIDGFNATYKHECDKMDFNKKQVLPDPSNRARVRPALLKGILTNLLELKQARTSSDMYMDYNREMLIESEKHGTPFVPITFNILTPAWSVPSEEEWPPEFWGLPLGSWLDKFRKGDIDAKQHWLRRDVLDYLQFDWGDGLRYLTFTWDKLALGLLWYINIRGHPIMDMPPQMVISNAELVAKWGKPEEIQGLKLGYIFYTAIDQIQVLRRYYPERYEFLKGMGLDYLWQDEVDLGYRANPHQKLEALSHTAKLAKDDYEYNVPSTLRILDCRGPPKAVDSEVCSTFENTLMDAFIPLLYYDEYYRSYNLRCVEHLLLCGVDSGKRFIRWFRALQTNLTNRFSSGIYDKLHLHIIRIEDILSPYYGESERRLVAMFESAVSNVGEGLTCVCIEGIHHFQSEKDDLSSLDRRLLATLLLLLDSVSKSDPILPLSHATTDVGANGPLLIVATSDKHPYQLSEALIRPGRLNRTITLPL
ncbi:uncharacterized protein BXIN_2073 [Babesia sp. Xinjiang]|uniref:uncharacterized protein n=1 Tax=Babesia sp. Xinjiang TaxID=462227 RepID=UPI000A215DAA|nr:uncharacterized protein BXIN_2073 [Babesia sp. Xinjiang]ORM40250.1 hypothetical protein BXIN_2073 [Babesia sp. Xinjiang]